MRKENVWYDKNVKRINQLAQVLLYFVYDLTVKTTPEGESSVKLYTSNLRIGSFNALAVSFLFSCVAKNDALGYINLAQHGCCSGFMAAMLPKTRQKEGDHAPKET